jgi:predicted AlkP superfamily pyrophosphatase or phosphodiesterase
MSAIIVKTQMRRPLTTALLCGVLCFLCAAPGPPPKKPKLILAVVVDQFRYDYMQRFRADYTAGFKRILEQGAVFEDAHHIHFPTVTAVGHSTFLSGATPNLSGIVGNEWFDRETGKNVTSVSDPSTKLLGTDSGADGSSPRRMLVSTLGDEIKMSGQQSKVIGVSIKDRAAILPAGHMADGAYWFDNKSGHWVTSTYYKEALPDWVEKINAAKPSAHAEHGVWYPLNSKPGAAKPYCSMDGTDGIKKCPSLEASPWGNEMIEDFAEHALTAEKLGQHTGTDVLAVSFSSNDYVGHAVGPDDPEVRDISVRTDRLLGKLLDYVDKTVGLSNVVFVMTADHGVAPVPEVNTARHMIGGRNSESELTKAMNEALVAKYGPGKWIEGGTGTNSYMNVQLIESKKLDLAEVELTAAGAARRTPHVFRVYTGEQLLTNRVLDDTITTAVLNGFYRSRSGDVMVIPEEFYIYSASGTTHGTPFNYDSHVPVIFMAPGIRPGHYYQKIAVNDIAPTLCAIAGVEEPSGSVGRVLQEMWQ